jgi:hypothetical protein
MTDTTYIATRDLRLNDIEIAPGQEIPAELLTNMDAASWVEAGQFKRVTKTEATAIAKIADKRTKASDDFIAADIELGDALKPDPA